MPDIVFLADWSDDGSLRPVGRHRKRADEVMVVGARYGVSAKEWHERSMASHRHQFPALKDYWLSLPEAIAPEFPTEVHFRKWLLIKTGYHHTNAVVASSRDQAAAIAALAEALDEFCITTVVGHVVTIYRAKSQKIEFMDNAEFQASKTAILEEAKAMVERRDGSV